MKSQIFSTSISKLTVWIGSFHILWIFFYKFSQFLGNIFSCLSFSISVPCPLSIFLSLPFCALSSLPNSDFALESSCPFLRLLFQHNHYHLVDCWLLVLPGQFFLYLFGSESRLEKNLAIPSSKPSNINDRVGVYFWSRDIQRRFKNISTNAAKRRP